MHSYANKDTTVSFEADSSNWEARLHIKPIRTHFLPDGSYYSEYRNVKDSLVQRPAGTWAVSGDSLTMSQSTPEAAVYILHVSIRNGIARFSGLIDFDGDGKRDDEYVGVQKKYR
ncbi:MAG: hypothetical protein Q8927_16050 [Bacteroidota bacterium]|nr:hypothetical protein [Bacteroidota bacterium]MDP4217715.1 hypothetical protein [Bacteroidota bacterium]MDP4247541.1 hypothetical protein [Bacteroidota bacterium]MDP4254149.1 hypothetical protein [Bacteroidota bacterium]MDP4259639.1 hypothetical protein [Bacteroidota bacterium]